MCLEARIVWSCGCCVRLHEDRENITFCYFAEAIGEACPEPDTDWNNSELVQDYCAACTVRKVEEALSRGYMEGKSAKK